MAALPQEVVDSFKSAGASVPSTFPHVPEHEIVSQVLEFMEANGIIPRDSLNLKFNSGEVELRVIESLNIVDMLDRASSSTSASNSFSLFS